MSAVTIDNDLVHYEVLGRGRPVVLLHGWLNSWRYWVPAMQQLSTKYRTYALDLWGYGDSSKDPAKLTMNAQIQLLADFMDKLGIPKAAFIGHSLGGAVMVRYALRNPDRVARLMVISPPVFDDSPISRTDTRYSPPVKPPPAAPTRMSRPSGQTPSSEPPVVRPTQPAGPAHSQPTVYRRTDDLEKRLQEGLARRGVSMNPGEPVPRISETNADPEPAVPTPTVRDTQEIDPGGGPLRGALLGKTSADLLTQLLGKEHPEYERFQTEASKTAEGAFAASIQSFDRIDLAQDLRRLTTPTFLLHGQVDSFLPPPSNTLMTYMQGLQQALRCEVLPQMGHFPMVDDPTNFQRLVMDFLEVRNLADLVLHKERWVRKVR